MKAVYFLVAILALTSSIASAYDPSPLQDFCVALNDTKNAGTYNHSSSLLLYINQHDKIIKDDPLN